MAWGSNAEYRYGAAGAKGDAGEDIVKLYCIAQKIPFDHKTDRHSQVVLKIDFIIDGKTVDVKSNYYKGMLAVELYTVKNGPGWLYTTTADQIYGVDVESKSIFRYNVSDMKEYASANRTRAKKTRTGDYLLWVPASHNMIERLQ